MSHTLCIICKVLCSLYSNYLDKRHFLPAYIPIWRQLFGQIYHKDTYMSDSSAYLNYLLNSDPPRPITFKPLIACANELR